MRSRTSFAARPARPPDSPGPPEIERRPSGVAISSTLALLSFGALVLAACRGDEPPGPILVEVTTESGLDFVHWSGLSGRLYYSEVLGSGAALFDYDGDGDLDVYLVQGQLLVPGEQPLSPPPSSPARDRLFRNEGIRDGVPRFTDVTEESGLDARGYGMGVATGDVDGDGWTDLYVTNLGSNELWRNRGDGTFEEATERAGVDDPRWSTAALFFDFDRDGDLDLFVVNSLRFDASLHTTCTDQSSREVYCGPLTYDPVPDRLFRNRGDGTFEDVTGSAGLGAAYGAGLGAVAADLDGDGWLDLYVANDASANQLWRNRGDGSFEEIGVPSGTAFNLAGLPEAGMGVDVGDVDGDGDPDLFSAHLAGETNTLYLNDGQALFVDATDAAGLGNPSLPFTTFGSGWLDVDSDGDLDLAVVSGAVRQLPELVARGDPFPLRQPNQLFRNEGGGRFVDWTEAAGPAFERAEVSRGLAIGDVDDDGDADLLVTNNNGPARLFLTAGSPSAPWLGVHALAAGGGDAPGAELVLLFRRGRAVHRHVRAGGSYLSAGDPRVLFAAAEGIEHAVLVARWPDGTVETHEGLGTDHYLTVRQGGGRPPTSEELAASGGRSDRLPERPGAPTPLPTSTVAASDFAWPSTDGLEPAVAEQLVAARRAVVEAETPADEATAYGHVGGLYLEYGLEAAAVGCLERARQREPGVHRWAYLLGYAELRRGRAEEAIAALEAAADLRPGDAPTRLRLAEAHVSVGQLSAARDEATRLVEEHPSFAAGRALRAQIAILEGQPEIAIPHYRAALVLQPQATRLRRSLALVLRATGREEEAGAELAQAGEGGVTVDDPLLAAIQAEDRSSGHLRSMGEEALASGRYEEAETAFRRYLELRPDDRSGVVNLAVALRGREQPEAARRLLAEHLERRPDHAGAWFNLGVLEAERGDDRSAIEHYRRALALQETLREAHVNLANALVRTARDGDALPHFRRAVELEPAEIGTRDAEIRSLARLGRWAEALVRAEETARLDRERPAATRALARLLAATPEVELRDPPRALALARQAFARQPTAADLETEAMALAAAGDTAAAAEIQRRVVQAVFRRGDQDLGRWVVENLERYERGLPAAVPWRDARSEPNPGAERSGAGTPEGRASAHLETRAE